MIGGSNSASTGVNAVVVRTDKGYRVEASVPLCQRFLDDRAGSRAR